MSIKPSWKDCEDCCNAEKPYPHEKMEKLAKAQGLSTGSGYRELVGTVNLSTLCEKCILVTPCSSCKKILSDIEDDSSDEEEEEEHEEDHDKSITMEISNFDEEPICSKCIKKQCSDCGEDGGFIKTWYGSIICEECSMKRCNMCGGGECNNPCSNCERSCDYECDCEIDCAFCDNKIRYYDFVHDESYRHNSGAGGCGGMGSTTYSDPICPDCASRACWNCGGPCAELCEDCGTCDQCNCSKKKKQEANEEEEEGDKEEEKEDDEEKEDEKEEKQQSQSFLQYLQKCLMIIGVFLINTIKRLKLILLSYSNNLYQNGRRLYLLLFKSINAWYSQSRHDRKDA